MAVLTPVAKMQFIKEDGTPLVGGKLYTYAAGTTTPLATYTDSSGGTPNTNPIILDSRGEANVWLGTNPYKFKLDDAANNELWVVDNISAPTSGVSPVLSGNVTIDTNSAGAALKITQTGTGYALRVQDSADPDTTSTVIDNQGRLGVGTVSPSELMDISGGNLAFTSSGGTLYAKVTPGASSTDIAAAGARALTFSTDNSERIRITDTGLVGIGKTPSAGVKLDVVGDIAASVSVKVDTVSEFSSGAGVTVAGVLLKNNVVAGAARPILAATAQATTSGTGPIFNDLPSYVNRITVLFNGVSLSGSDNLIVQLGTGTSGSPVWVSSGYSSGSAFINVGTGSSSNTSTSGFIVSFTAATTTLQGIMQISKLSSGVWASQHNLANGATLYSYGAGVLTGAGIITQVLVTRTGTNTFDAGSVNIFYE